jgi:hypothetical protein
MQKGDTNGAERAWTAMAYSGSDPVLKAGDGMRRRWMSRLDREAVRAALQAYYRKEIAYPAALDQLAAAGITNGVPLRDRFDDPWEYSLASFSHFKDLAGQRYELTSKSLRRASDLAETLRKPYAWNLAATGATRLPSGEGVTFMRFTFAPDARGAVPPPLEITLGERDRVGKGIQFVYAGRALLVLAGEDYWCVVKP